MIINEKDIELSKPNRFPPITVKQGDNARQITARLFNDGEQYLVTSGFGVRLNAKRSDGQKNYSIGWVNDDGTVTVQITSWMVAVVGMVTCDISVFVNEQQAFTTTNFYLSVEEATNKDGVIGGNDTPIDEQFTEIMLQINGYVEQVNGYVEQARQYAQQASTVDHIIEQNSGVPVKVWVTNDKKEFDDLETKQPNTLHVYPSVFDEEAVLNGTQPVGRAVNADYAATANTATHATHSGNCMAIGYKEIEVVDHVAYNVSAPGLYICAVNGLNGARAILPLFDPAYIGVAMVQRYYEEVNNGSITYLSFTDKYVQYDPSTKTISGVNCSIISVHRIQLYNVSG